MLLEKRRKNHKIIFCDDDDVFASEQANKLCSRSTSDDLCCQSSHDIQKTESIFTAPTALYTQVVHTCPFIRITFES